MSQLARRAFTFADYVFLEESSPIKHEFLDGVVYAMAGGSPDHAAVCANVIRLLGVALEGKRCRVFTSDLRIRVQATGLGTYPDTSVICGRLELDPEDAKGHTAINPTLLVEVSSPSTDDYDRGEKLAHYKRIASLREVLLLAHDERRVDLWRRAGGHFTQLTYQSGERVVLESLDATLAVDELYRDPLA
ncbi:MAG: Uma2 family endonuclease [Myxococcales bacterium]|nr:Uma2 family endonuclease [Myxococcales bacterium]